MQKITRAEFIEKITAFNGWTAYHNGAYDGERVKKEYKPVFIKRPSM